MLIDIVNSFTSTKIFDLMCDILINNAKISSSPYEDILLTSLTSCMECLMFNSPSLIDKMIDCNVIFPCMVLKKPIRLCFKYFL